MRSALPMLSSIWASRFENDTSRVTHKEKRIDTIMARFWYTLVYFGRRKEIAGSYEPDTSLKKTSKCILSYVKNILYRYK